MIEDVPFSHAFLDLDELQSHAWTDLEWTHGAGSGVTEESLARVPVALGGNAHLRQAHGALLGRHVAASGAGLRQLRDVVIAILFCFALRQVGPPEDAKRLVSSAAFYIWMAPLSEQLTSSAAH